MYKDIEDIRKDYDTGKYSVGYHYPGEFTEEILTRLPENYVFDEELSVKRNREMVEEHNQRVEEARALKRQKQLELNEKLTEDVVEYILENYNLTNKQARIVERWVYREKHSFMCDYFSYIDTFAEFADDIVNQVEEE